MDTRHIFLALMVIILLTILPSALALDCPFCSGGIKKFIDINITPSDMMYNKETTITVTEHYGDDITPVKERTDVEIWFYDENGEMTRLKFETDANGVVKYKPRIIGYYLVKSSGKSLLIYSNTTCGDGACGGIEDRASCSEDCGNCGDGICDNNEDTSCKDCSVCGDRKCTTGESRNNCLRDCVICGDAICDYLENRTSCPLDCESGQPDGACDGEKDNICDPDCTENEDPDCSPEPYVQMVQPTTIAKKPKTDNFGMFLIAAVLAVVLVAAVVLLIWRKKSSGENNEAKPAKKSKLKKDKKEVSDDKPAESKSSEDKPSTN